jgi:hypothetical protein
MKLFDKLTMHRDTAFRAVQNGGLEVGAKLSARALGERLVPGELEPWQHEAFRALVDTICDPGDSGLPEPSEVRATEVALRYIRWMPAVTQQKLSRLVATLEGGPLVLGPRRARFSSLNPDERARYLRKWSESSLPPMRAAFHAVKQVAMMGYYSQPGTWPGIGYSIDANPGAPDRLRSR